MTDRIFQIGAGQVGRGLNRAFSSSGTKVVGLHGRRPSTGATSHGALPDAIGDANVILVSVRDNQIDDVFEEIAATAVGGRLGHGTVILHTSPVAEPNALIHLASLGFPGGTFHPLIAFSNPERAAGLLRGGWIGIDGDATARAAARRLAAGIGARTLDIPAGRKSAYHAAAIMGSSFPVVVASVASRLLQSLGITETSASHAIESLMTGAMANMANVLPDEALTGPVARGDSVTVGKHINGLKPFPSAQAVYRALSNAAVEIAERRGVDAERLAALRGTLATTARPPAPGRGEL
jgi:predicted short-subunit dehydrogenase-like oxidoreductase (DUF2520 family)